MMRFITICALVPLIFYDFTTSVAGGFAVLDISGEGNPIFLIRVFPFALSMGAIALNFWTKQIWAERNILSLVWIMFLLFDGYTTFLGIVGFMTGSGLWAFPYSSIAEAFAVLNGERVMFALAASAVVVASPMSCNLIYHQDRERKKNDSE